MNVGALTNEDKVFIRTIFNEIRIGIDKFSKEREFNLSNPQLFTFLTYCPAALAIASDGTVDEAEIATLERITKFIDVKKMVNLDLMEFMSIAPEPENVITNEEFNIRVGSEILFLSKNMKKYEADFIKAVKALLTFDLNPSKDGSLTKSFSKLMDEIIENNVSINKEEEMTKMKNLKTTIGV
jgi:hypothetical protein